MAQQLPAFKGKFGSTEFWLATMRVGELVTQLKIPKEMPGWDNMNPEERYQREVDYKRVRQHIAPYMANDPDRFIGSFIVTIMNPDDVEFESLADAGLKAPKAMAHVMGSIGVLYLSGSEILVPLDGQHRLAALQMAVTGKDNEQKTIAGISENIGLADEVCSVILVKYEKEKSRKIFNKVNRYAKPTNKSDNLITADDDFTAVLCRDLILQDYINSKIVSLRANALSGKSGYFTTLPTVYEISKYVIRDELGDKKIIDSELPPQGDQELYRQAVEEFWPVFLTISAYADSIENPDEEDDKKRADIREHSVNCRPIAQRAIAEAIINCQKVAEHRIEFTEAVDRLNSLDWSPDNSLWQGILLQGTKIITGNAKMKMASRMIGYLIGEHLETIEVQTLRDQFKADNPTLNFPDSLF